MIEVVKNPEQKNSSFSFRRLQWLTLLAGFGAIYSSVRYGTYSILSSAPSFALLKRRRHLFNSFRFRLARRHLWVQFEEAAVAKQKESIEGINAFDCFFLSFFTLRSHNYSPLCVKLITCISFYLLFHLISFSFSFFFYTKHKGDKPVVPIAPS